MSKYLLLLILFLAVNLKDIYAQEEDIEQLIEWFTIHPNKGLALQDSTIYPAKIIMAPVISFSPETSLAFGLGIKWLFKIRGSGDETRTSNVPISLTYTLKNQFIIFSGFEIFFPHEEWMLEGNLIFRRFPRLYYGIGRNTPDSNEEEYTYDQMLIEPILLKRAFHRYLFLGGGVRYNRVSGVRFMNSESALATSEQRGINGSTSLGLALAAVFDSRNNLLNTKRGWYMEITHGFYSTSYGSDNDFQLSRLDLRRFFQPFKNRDDVVAFQLKTHFAYGEVPLHELAFFGSDEIMRGYYEGRFIERNMIVSQIEYRRNIRGKLGMIAFLGAGDVAHEIDDFRFGKLKPSYGFGLRFLLDEREDLNIRFDWGFGQKANNYYLNISEAF